MATTENTTNSETVKLSCYVDKEFKKEIKEHCKKIGLSESSYLRMLAIQDIKK